MTLWDNLFTLLRNLNGLKYVILLATTILGTWWDIKSEIETLRDEAAVLRVEKNHLHKLEDEINRRQDDKMDALQDQILEELRFIRKDLHNHDKRR